MSKNSVQIQAPLEEVSAILADIESYPKWSTGIKSVSIESKDNNNHPIQVTSAIDAGVMKDRVSLKYNWDKFPSELSFELEDADLLTEMDGTFKISGSDDDVQVEYELVVKLSMPVPTPMREKTELATIDLFLKQLKEKAEG